MPRAWRGAKHAVAKIEAGMAWAQRTGVLHEFNQEYRRRRLEAHGRGEWFIGSAAITININTGELRYSVGDGTMVCYSLSRSLCELVVYPFIRTCEGAAQHLGSPLVTVLENLRLWDF